MGRRLGPPRPKPFASAIGKFERKPAHLVNYGFVRVGTDGVR
jgi:hypothetical protein